MIIMIKRAWKVQTMNLQALAIGLLLCHYFHLMDKTFCTMMLCYSQLVKSNWWSIVKAAYWFVEPPLGYML